VDLGPGRPDPASDIKVERYRNALFADVLGKEIKWLPSRPGSASSAPRPIPHYANGHANKK
jgi:hypothetical protein